MINIDGSYGEGGGQILRNAVALSALKKESVEINNIRANRPKRGIKPQHYTAINIIKQMFNAKTEGLKIGSSHLKFIPGEPRGGVYNFNIGTAGSIVLVFQACILSLLKTKDEVTIRLTGGTDVKWSPSWDYFKYVFLPLILKTGLYVHTKLIRRGYYPKGSGEAVITIKPNKSIRSLFIKNKQNFDEVDGIIHMSNLPDHVGNRMKISAIKTLMKKNFKTAIKLEVVSSSSMGVGITLWAKNNETVLGKADIGEKGIPAEKIGKNIAEDIINEIISGATIDLHAFDQIIPYMVLTNDNKSSCIVKDISNHAKTNMWLISRFFENKDLFNVDNKYNLKVITVNRKSPLI